jgi:hypothetical protein
MEGTYVEGFEIVADFGDELFAALVAFGKACI